MGYDVGICKVKWNRPASSYLNGKQYQTREYTIWRSIMQRVKPEYVKRHRGYEGVCVSDNFKNYDWFYDWMVDQIGFNSVDDKDESFQIDKDLLGDGSIYHEDYCVFLPRERNNALIVGSSKKELPLGVYRKKNRYIAKSRVFGKERLFGSFTCPYEAHKACKEGKEFYIKELAHKWKDKIDPRAFDKLMKYEVE